MVTKKTSRTFSDSAFSVAGARHVLYGKNAVEPAILKNQNRMSTSSILLAETMPTLIRILEPNNLGFRAFSEKYQTHQFTEILPLELAMITEISLD